MEHFFPRIQVKTKKQKKGLHQKWNTYFSRIQVQTCAQMHTRVKLLEGMQMTTKLNLLGDTVKIGGYIPPGFRTTAHSAM